MKIDSYEINNNSPVFIIAELSANHNGSLSNALETIKAAKRAGAGLKGPKAGLGAKRHGGEKGLCGWGSAFWIKLRIGILNSRAARSR